MTDAYLKPFKIAISDEDIDDLKARIRNMRWLEDFANESWTYGMPQSHLQELGDYWVNKYDWRKHEAEINAYDQYRVVIDNVPIHFLWVKARKPSSGALILSHGWPWTFWDYKEVIPLLSNPAEGLAYDLVVPSLPGFGFSSPLRETGINPQTTADLWAKLMTLLDYEKFGAVGGDWGAFVTANLNHAHADRLTGTYLSLSAIPGFDFTQLKREDYDTQGEEDWYERWTARMATARAHGAVNTCAPQTVGYAFNDSPLGLASWIIERRRLWSDWQTDHEEVLSKETLLTGVSIYWFTQTVGTAGRFYQEGALHPFKPRHDGKTLQAPTAFGIFPRDLLLLPRTVAEKFANVARWTIMPKGGHFASAEQPRLLADDVQSFFAERIGQ